MAGEQLTKDVATNHGWFVLTTLGNMQDAEFRGDNKGFFIGFKWAARLLMPYMEGEKRAALERDFNVLVAAEAVINRQPETGNNGMNTQTKESTVESLRAKFADSHAFLVFEALPKASIVKISQDAVISYQKQDWQTVGLIVRSIAHSGMKTGMIQALEREELKHGTSADSRRV